MARTPPSGIDADAVTILVEKGSVLGERVMVLEGDALELAVGFTVSTTSPPTRGSCP